MLQRVVTRPRRKVQCTSQHDSRSDAARDSLLADGTTQSNIERIEQSGNFGCGPPPGSTNPFCGSEIMCLPRVVGCQESTQNATPYAPSEGTGQARWSLLFPKVATPEQIEFCLPSGLPPIRPEPSLCKDLYGAPGSPRKMALRRTRHSSRYGSSLCV